MDDRERERLAVLEEAFKGMDVRRIPHLRQEIIGVRGDIDESRKECSRGIAALAENMSKRFDKLDEAREAAAKERRAKRLALWSPVIGALAGGAVLLALKVVGIG